MGGREASEGGTVGGEGRINSRSKKHSRCQTAKVQICDIIYIIVQNRRKPGFYSFILEKIDEQMEYF